MITKNDKAVKRANFEFSVSDSLVFRDDKMNGILHLPLVKWRNVFVFAAWFDKCLPSYFRRSQN